MDRQCHNAVIWCYHCSVILAVEINNNIVYNIIDI